MKINFVNLFAKVLVVNFLLLLVFFVFFRNSIAAGELALIVSILVSINGLSAFMYPLSVIFKRTGETSYQFLQSWLHYIALTISALYWIVLFI